MTTLELIKISNYFQMAGSLAITASCLSYFNERTFNFRILGLYALASLIFSMAQVLSGLFFSYSGVNEIGNASVLSEILFFALFFFYTTKSVRFEKGVFISAVIYVVFYVIALLFYEDRSYSFIRFGRDTLMIFYALAYFYYLIKKLPEENLLKFPMFWINSAIIFYFSGTVILSLFRDYIVTVLKNDTSGFLVFRNFFRFVFCLVLSYAGWLDLRLRTKSSSSRVNL